MRKELQAVAVWTHRPTRVTKRPDHMDVLRVLQCVRLYSLVLAVVTSGNSPGRLDGHPPAPPAHLQPYGPYILYRVAGMKVRTKYRVRQ